MKKLARLFSKYHLIILLVLLIPAIQSLVVPGFYGASDDMHPAWIHQMDRTLRVGQFPPRFVPDLSFGFGYPLFNFISPLPFYIGEGFHLLGLNLVDSVKATYALSVILSGLTMYLLVRSLAGGLFGVVAALIYVYTPYRATDIYIRGTIGELWAFVFYPLIILSICKVCEDKSNLRWIGIGGLAIAGLILSHNIGTYMFLPFALILALILLVMRFSIAGSINAVLVFGLGLVVSIYFWLPALLDSGLMKYETIFSFADHFPTLKQLVTPYFGFGGSTPGPDDTMSFFIGVANLALVITTLFVSLKFWGKLEVFNKSLVSWSLLLFFTSVVMMNHRSTWIWISFPLLDYFQFPWRFLMMTTLSSSLFVLPLTKLKYGNYLAVLIAVVALATTYNYFRPEHFLGREDEYYLKKYIPVPVVYPEYLEIQEEYLRLPQETKLRPDQAYPYVEIDNGYNESAWSDGINARMTTVAMSEVNLSYNKYSFPGWEAKVDGNKVEIKVGSPFGQIEIKVPEGVHLVELKFTETPLKVVLDIVSITGVVMALWLIIGKGKLNGL